jgi:hypothetical protein
MLELKPWNHKTNIPYLGIKIPVLKTGIFIFKVKKCNNITKCKHKFKIHLKQKPQHRFSLTLFNNRQKFTKHISNSRYHIFHIL